MINADSMSRYSIYDDEDSDEVLVSRSTWPLKLSGLVFAGLLIVGRSATYGNVTWTPAYHAANSPLLVVATRPLSAPKPAVPTSLPRIDWAASSKRSAAEEVVVFSAGLTSGEGEGEGNG